MKAILEYLSPYDCMALDFTFDNEFRFPDESVKLLAFSVGVQDIIEKFGAETRVKFDMYTFVVNFPQLILEDGSVYDIHEIKLKINHDKQVLEGGFLVRLNRMVDKDEASHLLDNYNEDIPLTLKILDRAAWEKLAGRTAKLDEAGIKALLDKRKSKNKVLKLGVK